MENVCKQSIETPLENYCYITRQECIDPCVKECDEPYWAYLMSIAKDYKEED